jgi:hypothetical protein
MRPFQGGTTAAVGEVTPTAQRTRRNQLNTTTTKTNSALTINTARANSLKVKTFIKAAGLSATNHNRALAR